jgi:hypothetical protein
MSDSNKNYAERYNGVWALTGTSISFKREWSGVVFTDEQCEALLKGDVIEFKAISKNTGKPYTAKGSLAEQEYNGRKYIGFKADFSRGSSNDKKPPDKTTTEKSNADRYKGVWKKTGETVSFKREWSGIVFTDKQCKDLLNGRIITFEVTSKKTGKPYIAKGSLTEKEYEGKKFVGFEPDFSKGFTSEKKENNRPDSIKNDTSRYKGVWKKAGKEISFKREWSGVRFNDTQCEKLLANMVISFMAVSSKTGDSYEVSGSLKEKEYNGRKYVGFEPDFEDPYYEMGKKYGDWSAYNFLQGKGWQCPICIQYMPADTEECYNCGHIVF